MKVVKLEVARLQRALERIKSNDRDENGPLDATQRGQIEAAISKLGVAATLVECIQDHAPYQLHGTTDKAKRG